MKKCPLYESDSNHETVDPKCSLLGASPTLDSLLCGRYCMEGSFGIFNRHCVSVLPAGKDVFACATDNVQSGVGAAVQLLVLTAKH